MRLSQLSDLRFDNRQVPRKYTPFLAIDSVYFRWALKSIYRCASQMHSGNELNWLEELVLTINSIKPINRTQSYYKLSLQAISLLFDSIFNFC